MVNETCECVFKLHIDPTGATIAFIMLVLWAGVCGYWVLRHLCKELDETADKTEP